tara:strand:+ start:355 stop:666 length:312 start_codon:yes stop_codon:yes gene_type:complete
MNNKKWMEELTERIKSIIKKTLIWTCSLYSFHIFNAPQRNYISSQVSEAIVYCYIYILTTLFVLMGLYITIALIFGNDNDMENICRFILDNHIAIMIAIIVNN